MYREFVAGLNVCSFLDESVFGGGVGVAAGENALGIVCFYFGFDDFEIGLLESDDFLRTETQTI